MAARRFVALLAFVGASRGARLEQASEVLSALHSGGLASLGGSASSEFPFVRLMAPAFTFAGGRDRDGDVHPGALPSVAKDAAKPFGSSRRPLRSMGGRRMALSAKKFGGEAGTYTDSEGFVHEPETILVPAVWFIKFLPGSLRPLMRRPSSSGRFHVSLAAEPETTVRIEIDVADEVAQRKLRMFQHLAGLPNVATYLDHRFVDGSQYLLMECVGRRSLDDVFAELIEDKPFVKNGEVWMALEVGVPLADAAARPRSAEAPLEGEPWLPLSAGLPLLVDVLRGVEGFNSRKVVHLDLSEPLSIGLRQRRAIITNFHDAACVTEGPAELTCRHRKGTHYVGSAYRQAPEMWGGSPTGPENNVWQVGLLFAKMLFAVYPTDTLVLEHIPDAYSQMIDWSPEGRERIHEVIREHFHIQKDTHFQALKRREPAIARILEDMLERDPAKRSTATEAREQLEVDSYAEQVSLVCAAAMKEIAVDMGSVERMWGEDTLIKVGARSKYNAKVDPSLAKSSDVARKACKRAIADSGAATSDTILQVVRAKAPNFLMLGANFKVEMALVEELVGEGCEGRLKAGALAAMPTNATRRSPADAASKMQALQMTEGFKLATRAAQEKAKAALAFVTALAEERPPDIKAAQECSFMSDVVAAAQWFLECHRDGGAPPIRGAKAFAPLVSQAQKAVADKTATLSMAAPLQLYWWLCPPASEETRKKTIKDIQAMTTGTLKAAVSASSRGSGKSTNKSKGQASGAEEAAAAMLG